MTPKTYCGPNGCAPVMPNREFFIRRWAPVADIQETQDGYNVYVELPGLAPENVSLDFENGVLTITGERKSESVTENARTTISERVYGSFERRFRFPKPVNADGISAEFRNGVLSVSLPKRDEVRPRTISVSQA